MKSLPTNLSRSFSPRLHRNQSGQALVEFAMISVVLMVLMFGVIDFGRALVLHQTIVNLSREGANLAARGTTMADTLDALVRSAQPLDVNQNGYIILTAVSADAGGSLSVADQQTRGGMSATSRIGTMGGGGVTLPVSGLPSPNQTLYVAEVFVRYTPITPVGQLLALTMPALLYDVAYF